MRQILQFGLSVDVVDMLISALVVYSRSLNADSEKAQLARDFLTMLQAKRTEMRD